MGHIGPNVILDNPAFIHESAYIYGKVYIGPDATVWINAAMRSEMFEIRIGARTNIQDFVMVHEGGAPTIVGEDCSITHHATLHGCEIGDKTLIGINATLMDGCKVGANSIVAGHAIIREGAVFPDNAVIAGVPAKQVAERDNSAANLVNARFYCRNGHNFAKGIDRFSEADVEALAAGK